MLRPLSPIVNSLHGGFAKHWVFRTLPSGKTIIANKATRPGPELSSPSMTWMQECWCILDHYWRTLSFLDKIEWARCSPRIHGHRVTGFIHFKTINLRRFLVGLSALQRPPDKFRNHQREFTMGNPKTVRAWAGPETKNPPDTPDPPPGPDPPPDNPCLPDGYCRCPEHCEPCPRTIWCQSPWRPPYDPPDFPYLPINQEAGTKPPDFLHICEWLYGEEVWWWDDVWEYKANLVSVSCIPSRWPKDVWGFIFDLRILHVPSMRSSWVIFDYDMDVKPRRWKCPLYLTLFHSDYWWQGDFHMTHWPNLKVLAYDPNV